MVRAGGGLELAWKLLGDCLEIASKLLKTLMLDDGSAWISHGVQAMNDGQNSNDLSHLWFDDA